MDRTHTSSAEHARLTSRAAVLSLSVALALIALKAWAWLVSGSVAMLASLADSALDLAASAITYFAVRYAAAPPDREHRFGHGKAEAFAGLLQGGLVGISGIAWADPVAALLVAAWLAYGAVKVGREAADHLLDREVPDETRARIRALAEADKRLMRVHDLRTRASGPYMHVQFHAELDPDLSLQEAHEIVVAAEDRIRADFPTADIIIHPDPKGRAEPHGHEDFERAQQH